MFIILNKRKSKTGFTLIELLLSIVILAIVTGLTFMTVSTVTTAWRRGTALQEDIHHGDFVIEQLVMALRSAYYPEKTKSDEYGMWFEDNGDDAYSSDMISWVKIGQSLVGKDCPYAQTPHRVQFYLEDDDDGDMNVAIRSWQMWGQPEDFEYEDVEPIYISKRVTGFNFQPAYPYIEEAIESSTSVELEWLEEWEETNKLPMIVEITLFMDPLEEGDDPVEIKRIVSIPVAELSGPWKKK